MIREERERYTVSGEDKRRENKMLLKLRYYVRDPSNTHQLYCNPLYCFYKSFRKKENDLTFKGAYWISSNSSFIQYCDSNIGLFSIAPPLVIALPTLR